MGREEYTGLAPKAEPLLLQIPPQNIQDGENTQESQQDQKIPPLCHLFILKGPQ